MSSTTDLVARLRSAMGGLDSLRIGVEAGSPWPLSDNFGTAPEASWGPPEVLAHVEEMVPYWLGEIERILDSAAGAQRPAGAHRATAAASPAEGAGATAAEPMPFGRVASDAVRLAIIERDRALPPRELYARIAASVDRAARRLDGMSDAEAECRGLHPRQGEMTVAEIAGRFIVGHLEEHVVQLRELLQTPPG